MAYNNSPYHAHEEETAWNIYEVWQTVRNKAEAVCYFEARARELGNAIARSFEADCRAIEEAERTYWEAWCEAWKAEFDRRRAAAAVHGHFGASSSLI